MKVCDFDAFAALPPGTVYSYWTPAVAAGLFVKGFTIRDDRGEPGVVKAQDFYERPLLPHPRDAHDLSPALPEWECRWGMFDYDQLFAVYEDADLAELAEAIAEARKDGGS